MTPLTFLRLLRAKLGGQLLDFFRRSSVSDDYHLFARVLQLDTGRLLQLLLAALQAGQVRGRPGLERLAHFDDLVFFLYSMLAVSLDTQLVREPQVLDALFADASVLEQVAAIVSISEEVSAVKRICSRELELLRQLTGSAVR